MKQKNNDDAMTCNDLLRRCELLPKMLRLCQIFGWLEECWKFWNIKILLERSVSFWAHCILTKIKIFDKIPKLHSENSANIPFRFPACRGKVQIKIFNTPKKWAKRNCIIPFHVFIQFSREFHYIFIQFR